MAHLGRNVLLLAATSLIADISGEMLMAVLPFLLVAQGAGPFALGVFGGLTDAFGHIVKAAGGSLADKWRRRKPFIVGGYATAALSRLGIGFAAAWPMTLAFRGLDRVGKGLRSAPRDALLAESVEPAYRGRAFGLHRTADTAGALIGAGVALVLVSSFAIGERAIVIAAALVGLLTLVPLAFVRDVQGTPAGARAVLEPASPQYRTYLTIAALFGLGNVSYLFYMLRAADVAGGESGALALYLAFNAVYVVAAYPAGMLADRVGKAPVLAAGFLVFAASAAVMALATGVAAATAAFLLLGLGFAGVDGTERAFAADLVGAAGRSTRLGYFHMTVGLATVAGGLIVGALYERVSPAAGFAWGAALPLLAIVLLAAGGFLRRPPSG